MPPLRFTPQHHAQMAELPLDPPLARMLLASGDMGCTSEVLTVVAMLRRAAADHCAQLCWALRALAGLLRS